jgi:hypothetical protein
MNQNSFYSETYGLKINPIKQAYFSPCQDHRNPTRSMAIPFPDCLFYTNVFFLHPTISSRHSLHPPKMVHLVPLVVGGMHQG